MTKLSHILEMKVLNLETDYLIRGEQQKSIAKKLVTPFLETKAFLPQNLSLTR